MGRAARGVTTGIVAVFAIALAVAVLVDGSGPLVRLLLLRALALLVVLFAASEVAATLSAVRGGGRFR